MASVESINLKIKEIEDEMARTQKNKGRWLRWLVPASRPCVCASFWRTDDTCAPNEAAADPVLSSSLPRAFLPFFLLSPPQRRTSTWGFSKRRSPS